MVQKQRRQSPEVNIWSACSRSPAIERNVEKVLGAVTHLPLRHWKPHMFFTGAGDQELRDLTQKQFPRKVIRKKTHPTFSLKAIATNAGFAVCPCTSRKPPRPRRMHYIPPSVAFRLRFREEVPTGCIKQYDP